MVLTTLKLFCDPGLPVHDVTWQQFETVILTLDPYQHNEIIEAFVSF